MSAARGGRRRGAAAPALVDAPESSLLDLLDNVLNKGVMVTGDVVLSLADVDLVYLRLSVLLCAVDKLLPPPGGE